MQGDVIDETPASRRFACTSCGKCCDRGPEMEIGEAARLADTFILSLIFKVHSLPANDRSKWAREWWRSQDTRRSLRHAIDEQRRHLKPFSAKRHIDHATDRHAFLTVSAIAENDGGGRCPAMSGNRCGIYERRPLTCRTVPLHYSRAPSTLTAYLDRFTQTPGYECETVAAPEILADGQILDEGVRKAREEAIVIAKNDQDWKAALTAAMSDPVSARYAGLPTFADVLTNSDRGYATTVPMLSAWEVALRQGLMERAVFDDACRRQIALLEMAVKTDRGAAVAERLALYRSALLQLPNRKSVALFQFG